MKIKKLIKTIFKSNKKNTKKNTKKDPNYKEEAQKYDNPIPSREFILSFIKKKKYTHSQLVDLLDITPQQKKPLRNRLRAMVRDKQLSCNAKGLYSVFSNEGLLSGEVIANPKGFGFIKLDKGGKDLRLSGKEMAKCMHGDKVKARLLNDRLDSEIVEVTKTNSNVVGRVKIIDNNTFVIADDRRITNKIAVKGREKYKEDTVLVLEIIKSPTLEYPALGQVISVLGDFKSEGMEIKSALIRNQIPDEFSEEALAQSKKLPTTVLKEDKTNRVDLTDVPFVTIDGDDSKDFDDAVFVTPSENGWELQVAIADVAHYVKVDSALDIDAIDRGNSVYFPRFVVPMLPEAISNGLCSLNEKVERLSVVCKMSISPVGQVLSYEFCNAVIFSHARLTYNFVNEVLAGEKEVKDEKIKQNIDNLYGLYQSLKIARTKRGVMDFDRTESKIIFDDNGKIKNIVGFDRGDSEKVIEECMLAANQSTAKFLAENKAVFPYRNHPEPTAEKIASTKKFLAGIGLSLSGGETPTTRDFAKTLKSAQGRVDENIIKTVILRTMKQANYHPENTGHFGLAFEDYTHFTSPIRRYSDLLVHREIKQILKGKKTQVKNIVEITEHISMTERRADEASRDVEKWLKCEYMQSKIGQSFEGVISGVASFGIFVELGGTFIDGLVAMHDLKDDYYIYDEVSVSLTGRASGKTYKLGDKVEVLLAGVNLEERQISLVLNQ
jgi:ribonuclease R